MATSVDELEVQIKASTAELKKGLGDAQKQLNSFQSSCSKVGSKISAATVAVGNILANAVTAAFRALSQEVGEAITRLDTLNNYSKVMSNLGIASSDAEKSISVLNEGILGLPTSLSDAALATQRLTAVNNNVAASTDMFLAMNNAILAGGAATETQATAMEQLIQAYSKGKPDAIEWRAMLTAMPAQMKQIANSMGYTSTAIGGDFQSALVSGKITMDDFMATVIKLNKEGVDGFQNFDTQARNATGGVQTSIKNLKIAIQRGLANIGDAIGQSNIAGFFNKITSAINTVSNYVAAFVQIVKQAVAWVSALFGGSGDTSKIVKETNSVSSSLDSAASGAGNIADGLDDANDSAKKLKKQLAAFDEMNTLTTDTGSGSGSDSGKGTGGGAWADYTWDSSFLDNASNKVQEALEKIKKAFSDIFGDIDFTNLGSSIIKLWNGIQNAIEGAKEAGLLFLKNFIAPLAKHALEDTIPRMFTAIGDTLDGIDFSKINKALGNVFTAFSRVGTLVEDMLADIIEIASPIVEWLMNFVVPPALEIIATIINTIGAVLGGIWDAVVEMYNNWIAPALEDLGKALEPILDALNDAFGFINDDASAFDKLKAAVKWVAEVLIGPLFEALGIIIETISILIEWITNAVKWVIDAVKSIIEWVGQLVDNIGQAFQHAWDWITGIFAGIGQWFSDRWNDVSNAFSSVGSWFSDRFSEARDGVQNAFSNIGSWFSDRWNDTKNALSSVGSWFSNTFSNGWNGVKNAFSGIGSWFNDRWNDIKNVFGSVWNVFSDIGRNMWEGIKNGLGNIGQKIGDIFSGAIDWVKNLFGIHSPSKLFEKFGGFIDEGFVQGIENGIGEVDKAMASLTSGFEIPDVSLNTSVLANINKAEYEPESGEIEPTHIVVNVGGEKLVDTIIDGLNMRSSLENRFVLNA